MTTSPQYVHHLKKLLFALLLTPSLFPDGLYTYEGSDSPDVSGNNGRPKNNVFESNIISNTNVGVKIKDGDDNTFTSESLTPSSLARVESFLWAWYLFAGRCSSLSWLLCSASSPLMDPIPSPTEDKSYRYHVVLHSIIRLYCSTSLVMGVCFGHLAFLTSRPSIARLTPSLSLPLVFLRERLQGHEDLRVPGLQRHHLVFEQHRHRLP